MALQIGDNFNYNGKKPNFERDSFETLAEMRNFAETSINDMHLAFCKETQKYYIFKDSNPSDPTTGKWSFFETEFTDKVDQSTLTETVNTINESINAPKTQQVHLTPHLSYI